MTETKGPAFFNRMDMVDALRGFALLGLFLIHAIEYFELYWYDTVPSVVHDVVFDVFAGKAFALFALCFGLSFHIIMDRNAHKGIDFTGRFAWRLTILFALGYLHGLIYRGDILTVLAPLGLLLIIFNRVRSNKALLGIAAFCFLQPQLVLLTIAAAYGSPWANEPPAFWSDQTIQVFINGNLADILAVNLIDGNLQKVGFYWDTGRVIQIVGLFLVGLVLGRIAFFQDPDRYRTARRVALLVLAAVAIGLNGVEPTLTQMISDANGPMARSWFSQGLTNIVDLAFMGVQVILFVELWRGIGKTVLGTLAPAGRMTLTLYILQSLIFVPVFYPFGLGLYDDLSQGAALVLGIVAFAAQMAGAHLWFRHYRYGPLEWAWRALTYTTTNVPFRKNRQAEMPLSAP